MSNADGPPLVPIRFGAFEVDLRAGELREAGVRISLQQQPFRVLAYLLEHRGEVVTRDELRRELWPTDTFVDFEHGLNVAIARVRDALGDAADRPQFVETLPKRGYRFIAPAIVHAPRDVIRRRIHALAWAGVGGAVAIASGIGLFQARRAPILTDRDTVLVADFVNKTGEEVFDDTLRQALTIDLEQSPFLSVMSRERVRETLKRMTHSPDDPVVGDTAREICVRLGASASINGSIARLGTAYLIHIEAVNCGSGEDIAHEVGEAAIREQVVKALGAVASRLRPKLGEPPSSARRFDLPLEQVTTSSLDALKAFSRAETLFLRTGDARTAASLLNTAIQLDPDFAIAYAKLSAVSASLGRRDDEVRYAQAAYVRRSRASQPERFYIDGRHCVVASVQSGRIDCMMTVYEQWRQMYPRDWQPYSNLAAGHSNRGQYEDALENSLVAIRLNPDAAIAHMNLVGAYMGLNRFAEARRATDHALVRHAFDDWIHLERFDLAFIADDRPGMDTERRAVAGKPIEAFMLEEDAEAAAFRGHLKQAKEVRTRAVRSTNGNWMGAYVTTLGAMFDAAAGVLDPEPDLSQAVTDVSRYHAGVAATLSHDRNRAAALLRQISEPDRFPGIGPTLAVLDVLAGRRAAGAIAHETPADFGEASRYVPWYMRGLAGLYAGEGGSAVVEFQRIIDHRGIGPTSPLYPLAFVQQGRAYTATGDAVAARKCYETFFEFWKDADPDVPILKEAKAEYAKLAAAGR